MPLDNALYSDGNPSLEQLVLANKITRKEIDDAYIKYKNSGEIDLFYKIICFNAKCALANQISGLTFAVLQDIVDSENGIQKIDFLTSANMLRIMTSGKCPFRLVKDYIIEDNDLRNQLHEFLDFNEALKLIDCLLVLR